MMSLSKTLVVGVMLCIILNTTSHAEIPEPMIEGVEISSINIHGSSVLSASEVANILEPYKRRQVHIEDLRALVKQVTKLYVEKGFVNSGAFLPEQDLAGGVLNINVVEGELTSIDIVESGRISDAIIRERIKREVGYPLNIADLQRAFNRIERDPTVDRIKGQLVPGEDPGESVLKLSVFEADAFNIIVSAHNYMPPSLGSGQLQFELNHNNMLGFGDDFHLGINKTEGDNSANIFYRLPLGLSTSMALYYLLGDSVVVEEPFDEIDVESESETAGFKFAFIFKDQPNHNLAFTIGFERKSSSTSLLGVPFDFGYGSVNGESKAAVAEIGAEYTYREAGQAFSVRTLVRKGIDTRGATILPASPDGTFLSYRFQMKYIRRLGSRNWLWDTIFNVQSTSDTLQSFERFSLGGNDSVRGYRENQVLRDNAYEFRTSLEIPLNTSSESLSLSFIPFADFGRGGNTGSQRNMERAVFLSSVGLGLRFISDGFQFRLEWAVRLSSDDHKNNDLQDKGVHVGLSYVF